MNRSKRFLLIIAILFILISVIGCDIKKDGATSTTGEIDTLKEKIEQTDISSKSDWEDYLSEEKYNRDVLDIKTPNEYKIDIDFDPAQKRYIGKQWVKYVNNEDVSLSEIYFHIYPNAFRGGESTTPYSLNSYIGDFNPGLINIEKVMMEGKESNYSILGDDDTLLKIPMELALAPEKSVEIYMEYEVILPNAVERFGYGDNTFQIGNGYPPIAAVYDSRGWNIDPYYSIGEPFYSDVSNYNITIKAPKDYIIACSGKILSEELQGESKIWNMEAKLMRDFAWAASQNFIIQEKKYRRGGIG